MPGKRVFVCLAAEDEYRLPPLLAAFTAWDISPTVFQPQVQPASELLPEAVQAISACDVYLRLCTGMTRLSPQVAQADATYRKVLEQDRRRSALGRRRLVNLILDPAYQIDEQDKATMYIDTAGKTRELWFEELAVPLGVATLEQRVSRRALLGMGALGGLALVSGGVAVTNFVEQQQNAASPDIPNTARLSGQTRWTIPLGAFADQSGADTSLFVDNGQYYALVNASTSAGMYALSPAKRSARLLTLAFPSGVSIDTSPGGIAGGLIFFGYDQPIPVYHPIIFRVSDGSIAFRPDLQGYSQPILDGKSFYCLAVSPEGNAYVSAFARQDFALRWQRPIALDAPNFVGSSNFLSVAGGSVYACGFDHTLTCYDAATGKQRWQFLAGGQVTAPAIAGGVVYAGARDGSIYALDAATGVKRWHTAVTAGIAAPPVVSDGVVYIGSLEGFLYALDANSGAFFWNSFLGGIETNVEAYAITSAPALYRNVIAVASGGYLFAYDLRNGSFRWQNEPVPGGSDLISPSVVCQGLFLIGSPNGRVYAVNP